MLSNNVNPSQKHHSIDIHYVTCFPCACFKGSSSAEMEKPIKPPKYSHVGVRIVRLPPLKRWVTSPFVFGSFKFTWVCSIIGYPQIYANLPNWISIQLFLYSTGWFIKGIPVHLHSPQRMGRTTPAALLESPCVGPSPESPGAVDKTLIQCPIQYSCKISSSHCSATSTAILNGVYSSHTKRMEYSIMWRIMCPISCQFCGASTGFTSITINHPIRTCCRADPIRQQNRFLEESFFKLGTKDCHAYVWVSNPNKLVVTFSI